MSVVRPHSRPPAPAAARGARGAVPVPLLIAAAVVGILFIWLVLRYLGAGGDADDAVALRDAHTAAAVSLKDLDDALVTATGTPEDLFQGRPRTEGAISPAAQSIRSSASTAQTKLTAAGSKQESATVAQAVTTFEAVIAELPTQGPKDGAGLESPGDTTTQNETQSQTQSQTQDTIEADRTTAKGAVEAFQQKVSPILTTENTSASQANTQVDDANSTRRSSMLFLVLLFVIVGGTAVAVWGGLIRMPALGSARYDDHEEGDRVTANRIGPAGGPQRPRVPASAYPPGATGPAGATGRDVFGQDDAWANPSPSTGSIPVVTPPAYLSGSAPEGGPITRARSTAPLRAKLSVTTSAHPGTTLDAAEHAGLAVFAGSMIGPEHRAGKNVAPREDAYGWAPGQDSSVIAVAVADGVGSARNSHAASLIATEMAIAHLRTVSSAQVAGWFEHPEQWTEQAQSLMTRVAGYLTPEQVDARARTIEPSTGSSNSGQRPLDPATTLVIALGVVGADGVRVLWASVGDSQVSVLAPGATQLSWTQDEGDSPSGTRALPRDTTRVVSSTYRLPPGHAFLLITDGCEKVLTLDPSTVSLLHEMAHRPGDVAPLLDLLQRNPRGAGDDRTLIMFAPVGGTS